MAKISMTRRTAAQPRARLVECDKEQQAIGRLISLLNEQLLATRSSNPDQPMRERAELVMTELAGLDDEVVKATGALE